MSLIPFSRVAAKWAAKTPGRAALVFEGEALSWEDFEARTNRLARAYAKLGVGQDDFVTIALPNGFEFVEACFAAWKLGATPQPVSYRLPKIERDAIIDLANPSLVVGVNEEVISCPHLPANYAVDLALSDAPLDDVRTASNVKAVTSGGSTGRPKLIVMPLPATWDEDFTYFTVPHAETTLVPGPLYHNGPFMWMLAGLCQGNTVILNRRFDAEETLRLIQDHSVVEMYAVPTMMQRIWRLPEEIRNAYDLSSLRALTHLAAPCPQWLKQAFIDWLGPEVIWEIYGGAEGAGGTIIEGSEWLEHRGSVGRPIPGSGEIGIFDEAGNSLPAGEIGEIFMKAPGGANSTYNYVGAQSNVREGGWDSLGDMGYMDADGYLYLSDRRTDMILCGGSNVYPAEVEAAIDACPGVRSSAVIGLPHEDMGNAVHAIVDAPEADLSQEQLLEFLQERLVTYKLPRSIEFVEEPLRDDAGKVRRKALREARLEAMKATV